jgi:hypothetical protein
MRPMHYFMKPGLVHGKGGLPPFTELPRAKVFSETQRPLTQRFTPSYVHVLRYGGSEVRQGSTCYTQRRTRAL